MRTVSKSGGSFCSAAMLPSHIALACVAEKNFETFYFCSLRFFRTNDQANLRYFSKKSDSRGNTARQFRFMLEWIWKHSCSHYHEDNKPSWFVESDTSVNFEVDPGSMHFPAVKVISKYYTSNLEKNDKNVC